MTYAIYMRTPPVWHYASVEPRFTWRASVILKGESLEDAARAALEMGVPADESRMVARYPRPVTASGCHSYGILLSAYFAEHRELDIR